MRNGRNAKSPAFQFYPGDFLADPKVCAMSTEAQGAYFRLLCFAWLDGSIPNDAAQLAPMCGLSHESFTAAWATVQRCWVESLPGRLVNPRLERERAFQAAGRARRLAASLKAVEARQSDRDNVQDNESSTNRATVDPLTLHPTPVARTPTPDTRDPKPVLGKKPASRAAAPPLDLDALVLGSSLDTPQAKAALREWIAYKAERRQGYTPRGVKALLSKLAAWGPARTEAAVRNSMASNWAGLFEPQPGASAGGVEPKGYQGIREYMAMKEANRERGA